MNCEVEVQIFKNERQLLQRFYEIVESYQPDVLADFFGDRFDIPFLAVRSLLYNISLEMQYYDEIGIQGLIADTAELLYDGKIFTGTHIVDGYYQFDILVANLTFGLNYMNITFTKATYQNATKEILVNINIMVG